MRGPSAARACRPRGSGSRRAAALVDLLGDGADELHRRVAAPAPAPARPGSASPVTSRQRMCEVLGDVGDDRAAQPGADVVPAEARRARVRGVSKRSPPRSVRSMPPTKATSSSTTTSFSWWQCIGRSRASSSQRTRVPRASSAPAAAPRPARGVKTAAARRPTAGRGPRRARPARQQLAQRVRRSSRSSSKCGVTCQPAMGTGGAPADRLGDRRQRLGAVDEHLERAPVARRRRLARPGAAVVGRTQRPRRPRRRRRHAWWRAIERSIARPSPRSTVPGVHGPQHRGRGAGTPVGRSAERSTSGRSRRAVDSVAQPVRACNACVHASKRCYRCTCRRPNWPRSSSALWHHLMKGGSEGALRAPRRARRELLAREKGALHALVDLDRPVSVKELAEDVGMSLPGASRLVEQLHQRGRLFVVTK